MPYLVPLLLLFPYFCFLSPSESKLAQFGRQCKPIPGSLDWPTLKQWQQLNAIVGGRLIAPVAPGEVCQPTSPLHNNVSCAEVATNWANTTWQAQNTFTSDYNDNTCLPSALAPCSATGYPAYVVKATARAHVQAAVAFASQAGVRLIVKGTGHDFLGRSAGPYSLSIYTHYMDGIEIDRNSPQARANGSPAAVKIAAGLTFREIYAAVKEANLTIVGGADLGVGIGGWILGGGHSPLSSRFGLGADQVLEMEVVTADGVYRVINQTSFPDLFWAMRGGGGYAYAVMLSVTVKAYPPLPTVLYYFSFNTTAASQTYWDMIAVFHAQIPALSERGGAMGYYYIVPNDTAETNSSIAGKLYGALLFPEETVSTVNATMGPILDQIKSHWRRPGQQDEIGVSTYVLPVPDFTASWMNSQPEHVGVSGRLGSYLLTNDSLLYNTSALASSLEFVTPSGQSLIGHIVAGPGVRNARIPGGSNAVLPAWRRAYVHMVIPRTWTWPSLNSTAQEFLTTSLRDVYVPALKELEPNSGAYVNEADPTNPAWKEDYWGGGQHYERLLAVKHRWDPRGVFWCKPCVGHDEWVMSPETDGVGQNGTQLCRGPRN